MNATPNEENTMTNFEKMVKTAGEAAAVNEFNTTMASDEIEILASPETEAQGMDMAMDIACARCLEYGLGADDKGADIFTESFTDKLFALACERFPRTCGEGGNCGGCGWCSAPTVAS